jgi:hypothetical protein
MLIAVAADSETRSSSLAPMTTRNARPNGPGQTDDIPSRPVRDETAVQVGARRVRRESHWLARDRASWSIALV